MLFVLLSQLHSWLGFLLPNRLHVEFVEGAAQLFDEYLLFHKFPRILHCCFPRFGFEGTIVRFLLIAFEVALRYGLIRFSCIAEMNFSYFLLLLDRRNFCQSCFEFATLGFTCLERRGLSLLRNGFGLFDAELVLHLQSSLL